MSSNLTVRQIRPVILHKCSIAKKIHVRLHSLRDVFVALRLCIMDIDFYPLTSSNFNSLIIPEKFLLRDGETAGQTDRQTD